MRLLAPIRSPLQLALPNSLITSPAWLEWFQRLTDYYNEVSKWIDVGNFGIGAREPQNPTEGLLAYADGINWNPGSGTGYYRYESGVWVIVGGFPFATTIVTETEFGQDATVGVSENVARGDHTHGTPIDPIPAHVAELDPHTVYQLRSEKGQVNGYAELDATTKVPLAQLVTGTADGEKFLADDRSLKKPEYFQIGSLYGTLTYVNPATILGYGTWELVLVT